MLVNNKKKVLLGLSGGVDSGVAAYLLKQEGYDVTGCFMRNWDSLANQDIMGNPTIMDSICPQEVDYQDAVKVAETVGIPILRIDFVKEYWDNVFTAFIDEYTKGRTPNPDILCNKYIKFKSFYDYAKEMGFDYLATGHYAKIIDLNDEKLMAKALDDNKDQTYFLSQVDKNVLDEVLFPLGEYTKEQIREIALDINLSIATKKDSTGICFIGERDFKEFLKNYIPAKTGQIIDVSSKQVLGDHEGVLYYTIGQRKGLRIGGNRGPWFVVGKDVVKNELYVSNVDENGWLYSDSALISDLNWFKEVAEGEKVYAKFRYRQADNIVYIHKKGDDVLVKFDQPIAAITPGQEAVFYNEAGIVLGGGVIEDSFVNGQAISSRLKEALGE
ncbi:MAG: tRNA 2-thiouridine(34) synthase MnmA [Erysipelothrix sp.]|nr:tRNA 2-thiouridine(34) synthase MnmA [Erysipelothrix sp.]